MVYVSPVRDVFIAQRHGEQYLDITQESLELASGRAPGIGVVCSVGTGGE